MKKGISILMAAILACSLFAGCGSTVSGTPSAGESSSAADSVKPEASSSNAESKLSGNLTLTGSTSMQEVCEKLGEKFVELHPDVNFLKNGAGSGEAPTAVMNGTAGIGDLSRVLKDSENPDQFTAVTIALDGIAVIINKESAVENLTQEQIKQIYTGEITDWSQVGGAAGAIKAIGREAASGTRDGFESILGIKDEAKYAVEQNATGAVISAVSSDKSAIGYVSLANVEHTKESIKAVQVDGVTPSMDTVADGTYKLQRPFVQIYKKGSTDPLVAAWFEFLKSAQGKQIIEDSGLVAQEIQ